MCREPYLPSARCMHAVPWCMVKLQACSVLGQKGVVFEQPVLRTELPAPAVCAPLLVVAAATTRASQRRTRSGSPWSSAWGMETRVRCAVLCCAVLCCAVLRCAALRYDSAAVCSFKARGGGAWASFLHSAAAQGMPLDRHLQAPAGAAAPML